MPNPSQTENWIVATLRDAPTPAPPVGLTTQMIRVRSRRRFGPWLAASGVASMTVLLIVAETLQPTTTLADVAKAQSQQTQYTIVNTRILGNDRKLKINIYRDGSRWRVSSSLDGSSKNGFAESIVMDGRHTVTVWHYPPVADFAELDESRTLSNRVTFDLRTILRGQGKAVKPVATKYQGKAADRFELHTTYRDRGQTQTYDQTVIADAKSHLPLRVEVYRDNRSWGDIWEYSYGPPAVSVFNAEIPPSTKTYDLPKERLELQKSLTKGAVLINAQGVIRLLLPAISARFPASKKASLEGENGRIEGAAQMEVPGFYKIKILGKEWSLGTLDTDQKQAIQGDRATLEIGNQRLADLPVFHISEEHSLLRTFTRATMPTKLGG